MKTLCLLLLALSMAPAAWAQDREAGRDMARAGDSVELETLRWRMPPDRMGGLLSAERLVHGRAGPPARERLDHLSFALLAARLDWRAAEQAARR